MNVPLANVNSLRETIVVEIFKAIGLPAQDWRSRLLEPLVWTPAQRFAELGARFDQYVAQFGLRDAAHWALPHFVKGIHVNHAEQIPGEGPLIIASNHPGTFDSLAITASIPRPDLKIIASALPFIRGLPATANHLIYTTLNPHERMTVIRSAIRHLAQGGALLIFPSGNIDPDPEIMPDEAEQALEGWSPSIEIMLRRVPQTRVVVTIIRGVLAPVCLRNPLTRLRKHLRDQQRIAEFIQVIQQMLHGQRYGLVPRITFGQPISLYELIQYSDKRNNLLQVILSNARHLLTTQGRG